MEQLLLGLLEMTLGVIEEMIHEANKEIKDLDITLVDFLKEEKDFELWTEIEEVSKLINDLPEELNESLKKPLSERFERVIEAAEGKNKKEID